MIKRIIEGIKNIFRYKDKVDYDKSNKSRVASGDGVQAVRVRPTRKEIYPQHMYILKLSSTSIEEKRWILGIYGISI